MAHSPLQDEPEPITQELIKIGGKGKDWECAFWERDNKLCTIYEHRPLECRLLECWNPSPLEDAVGQNTLTRADIIAQDDPINELIRFHELHCPIPPPDKIRMALSSEGAGPEVLAKLTELVHRDLVVRAEAIGGYDIPLPLEILYFGRPIHVILNAHGLRAIENNETIRITAQDKTL